MADSHPLSLRPNRRERMLGTAVCLLSLLSSQDLNCLRSKAVEGVLRMDYDLSRYLSRWLWRLSAADWSSLNSMCLEMAVPL